MNFFSSKKVYGGKWSVSSVEKFTKEECDMVSKVQVVDSQYGNSACFFMKNGTTMYTPMSNDSTARVGDVLRMEDLEIVTLEKVGEQDIQRIRG
jgi:hypothetical protein